jgi:RNA polymerase sigma-70 factor (ECF subfamily)
VASVLTSIGQRTGSCCGWACGSGGPHCRLLARAACGSSGDPSREALARLVEQAWPAVHALVRRQGARGPDAEDLTQAYFARFIDKGYARRLGSWNGCIRPFFLTSLRHFLSNARDHARAFKRGGRTRTVSLDDELGGGRASAGLADPSTPESLLASAEQQRAMRRAIAAVKGEARCETERQRLDRLLSHLEHGVADSRQIASDWGVSPGAVRVAVHRLRQRLARALAAETAARAVTDRTLRFS